MNKSNKISVVSANAPKVFAALARFLTEPQLAALAEEYLYCAEHGGNAEPGIVREPGVSFNPRQARVLSLLVTDGGVRDVFILRAVLYAACLVKKCSEVVAYDFLVPEDLRTLVLAVVQGDFSLPSVALIRGVIELDGLRHLHQTVYSIDQRRSLVASSEEILDLGMAHELPEWLRNKVMHAIVLQRRNIELSLAGAPQE
jgi:hypothetical protein